MQIIEVSNWMFTLSLLAWGFGIVLAIVMLRRGGGRAEKLLLAGCCLLFASTLVSTIARIVMQQMLQGDLSNKDIGVRYSLIVGLPLTALTLGGLACLVWGFWLRFRVKQEAA